MMLRFYMRIVFVLFLLAGSAEAGGRYPYIADNVADVPWRVCSVTFSGDNGATAEVNWCDGKVEYRGEMPVKESARKFFEVFPEVRSDYCLGRQASEFLAAADGVLPYLTAPSDDPIGGLEMIHAIHITPPNAIQRAEEEVKRLKAKDAAIRRFREALRKARGER